MITIFLYSSHLNKSAIEVLNSLGLCTSYTYLLEVFKRLGLIIKNQLKENANKNVMGVRGGVAQSVAHGASGR